MKYFCYYMCLLAYLFIVSINCKKVLRPQEPRNETISFPPESEESTSSVSAERNPQEVPEEPMTPEQPIKSLALEGATQPEELLEVQQPEQSEEQLVSGNNDEYYEAEYDDGYNDYKYYSYNGFFTVSLSENNGFACPTNYSYLSYKDSLRSKRAFNRRHFKDAPDGSIVTYRLLGGGSIDSKQNDFNSRPTDYRVLNKSACVYTNWTKPKLFTYTNECPSGYDVITQEEAIKHRGELCDMLPEYTPIRVALQATIERADDGRCVVVDWDHRTVEGILCIQREIVDLKIVDFDEMEICGEGSSLLTVEGVLSNPEAYCNVFSSPWDIVRLAGGGSLEGAAFGCRLHYEDTRPLTKALCGTLERKGWQLG